MPHIRAEYAASPLIEEALPRLLDALVDAYTPSAAVKPANVKLAAIACQHARVGGRVAPFVHIDVAMMDGPSESARADLAERLLEAAIGVLPDIDAITVDIRLMNPTIYRKRGGAL